MKFRVNKRQLSINLDRKELYDSDPDTSEEIAENGDKVTIWRNCYGKIISIQVDKGKQDGQLK